MVGLMGDSWGLPGSNSIPPCPPLSRSILPCLPVISPVSRSRSMNSTSTPRAGLSGKRPIVRTGQMAARAPIALSVAKDVIQTSRACVVAADVPRWGVLGGSRGSEDESRLGRLLCMGLNGRPSPLLHFGGSESPLSLQGWILSSDGERPAGRQPATRSRDRQFPIIRQSPGTRKGFGDTDPSLPSNCLSQSCRNRSRHHVFLQEAGKRVREAGLWVRRQGQAQERVPISRPKR